MASRLRVRVLPAVAGLIALAAVAGTHAPLSAQELPDSLRDVVRERLERLTRALGDSTGLVPDSLPPDSLMGEMAETESDSTLMRLLSLAGYNLIHYRSDNATFETDSKVLTLESTSGSQTVMNRDGMELAADSALVFDDNTGRLVSLGGEATFTPEDGEPVLTRQIIYDLNEQRGTALDAQTQTSVHAGTWLVRGDCPWVDGDVSYCHRMMFTSCDEEEPHYHFQAGEIKMYPGGTMVARNVTLYFADVGVFWLPFIAQSTATERRSGLLPLQFSVNDIVRTSGGYARRISNIGYYWAINDYADAQVALDWWSGNYTGVNGGLRYDWKRQFLNGGVRFTQFWRVEGGSELAINTDHRWRVSERTDVRASFAYASSSDFVRRNSFDPREVTQSIDSEGGFSRRFDWGNLSVNANRRQFLSDDRVESTFPQVSLSLKPISLFYAPPNRARFYNNMTWSARGNLSRAFRDLPAQNPDSAFDFRSADTEAWRGSFSTGLSLGAFSVAQSVNLNRNTTRDLPFGFFEPDTTAGVGVGSVGDLNRPSFFPRVADPMDFTAEELTWSTGVNYQVTLVGSTSLTPNLSISGRSIRSDTATVAGGGFIGAPRRLSFGASLKADLFGFYYGDRFRHKWSPTFDYAYSPETNPTELQKATFGDRAIQPRNEIRFGMNNTFEMKKENPAADSAAGQAAESQPRDRSEGPRRLPRAETVMVLAVRTSALTYDFVQADEQGHFTRGFADNLRISNQISSDYMRGLTFSMEHDIFDDGAAGAGGARGFAPFLSSANLSFSVSNESTVFRWLRRLTGGAEEGDATTASTQAAQEEDDEETLDPTGLETEDMGASSVLPRSDQRRSERRSSQRGGGVGTWSASLSYSLARNRGVEMAGNQMIQGNLRFQPTELWSVDWRTSYDVVAGAFNDHVVRLTRQMHRWEAEFAFQQTATGNWTFLFEVALTDNRDLHFDYEQRTGGDQGRRRPGARR